MKVAPLALCALGFAAHSIGQTQLNWHLQPTASSPPARKGHSMCYDSSRHVVVLFGGEGGTFGNTPLDDTWEYNGATWVHIPALGPSGRAYHSLTFDSLRSRCVLFGGSNGGGETWEFDGSTWTQSHPINSPSARSGHAASFDSTRGRLVVFGGSTGGGQTWEYDGQDWYAMFTATAPSPRTGHSLVFDASSSRTILFGGGQWPWLNDTWSYDGLSWSVLNPSTTPYGRNGHVGAFDSTRAATVIYGGTALCGSACTTWPTETWQYANGDWQDVSSGAGSPGSLTGHAMAFDSLRSVMVLFGGRDYLNQTNSSTWELRPFTPSVIATSTSYGSGCGTPPISLIPDQNRRPIIGQFGKAYVADSPTGLFAAAMGWSNQSAGPFSLPVTLGGIGMPGCYLYQSSEVIGIGGGTDSGGPFISYPVPYSYGLLGARVYLQAYAFAPNANPLQLTISNGIEWYIGNR